jgi:hypothetical protein
MPFSRLTISQLIALTMFWPVLIFAQAPQRVIEKASWRSEPIRIRQVKTNGRTVALGKKFLQDPNWLKGFSVSVQNVSNKAIARIEIKLSFLRDEMAASNASTYGVTLSSGVEPADLPGGELPKLVLPDDTVEVPLLEGNVPSITQDLASLGYPEAVTRARLTVESVIFADGSTWAGDEMLYPDPKSPKRKINPRLQNDPTTPQGSQPFRLEKISFKKPSGASVNVSPKLTPVQDPTLPCNTVFVTTRSVNCGDDGSGCSFKQNVFDGSIELLGLRNARSELSSTRCQRSDGTICTSSIISHFERLPCGARIAGTCSAQPDWSTYPTTGCMTGFTVVNGICSRSLKFQSRCVYYDPETCTCPDGVETSPILIDVDRSGFSLTDASGGVDFDIFNDSVPLRIAWTTPHSSNAFLALDRNGNGRIDNGAELFGNVTPQPPSLAANGFLALAVYDKPENGGNRDGRIDKRDAIFPKLLLWRDANHNGQSEAAELRSLLNLIGGIELNYKESKRTDQHGNQFRYRAKVYDTAGSHAGKWAWDVFLSSN